MAAIVLLLIALLPLGLAIARRHARTRAIMANVDQGMEEWEIKALGRLSAIKQATIDPLTKVLATMLIALHCYASYFTHKYASGWFYVGLNLASIILFVAAYWFLMLYRRTVQTWVYLDRAANEEYAFDKEADARRLDPTLANTRVESKEEPMGLVLWLAWFVYLPIVAFAVNFGIGITTEERYLILIGIGWGSFAVVEIFAMLAFAAMIFGKVVGGTETLLQLLTSTFGSLLPASVDQKNIEKFFTRFNIGDEEKYLPSMLKQFWYTFSLFLFITVPCLIAVKNIYFVWAEMPPFVVVLIFTTLFLFIKTQLKSVDQELRVTDTSKLDRVDRIRSSGVFFSLYASILLATLLLVHALLSALGYWDWVVSFVTGATTAASGGSSQGLLQGIWKFFSAASFWETVFYFLVFPGLVIALLFEFAGKLEPGWGKRFLKGLTMIPLLVVLMGFANLIVNRPPAFGGSSTPAVAAPSASSPKRSAPKSPPPSATTDDDGRVEVAGSSGKRNAALDEHCRKFGCPSSSK